MRHIKGTVLAETGRITRSSAKKKRRRLPGCPTRGCTRTPYRRGSCDELCRVHLTAYLDKAARTKCLADYGLHCTADGAWIGCSADAGTPSVQWAHIVRRGRGLTRRLPGNAIPLCAAHHTYYTHRPEAWTIFVDRLIGVEEHRKLMHLSLADEQLDLAAEWDALKEQSGS